MRKTASTLLFVAALAAAIVVASRPAHGDEYNASGTIVQGVNIRTATGFNAGSKIGIQCPNVDGGAGQLVYYRPGGCSTCVVDAGPGDVLLDFRGNFDPYPVTLRAGMDCIHVRAYNAADAVFCIFPALSP